MPTERGETFEQRLLDATGKAADLGIALRDLHREFPDWMAPEDLLELAASILTDGFAAPAHVKEIHVRLGTLYVDAESPMLPKPATVQ